VTKKRTLQTKTRISAHLSLTWTKGTGLALKQSMNARQLKKPVFQIQRVFHYTIGRVYTLEDIKSLSPKLKTISSRTVNGHMFHLFRETGTHNMWMEGPFRGPGSSGFMYLGPKKTKSQLKQFLLTEFKTLMYEFVDQAAELVSSNSVMPVGRSTHYCYHDPFDLGGTVSDSLFAFDSIDASDWSE
jgi:hypothetical protein